MGKSSTTRLAAKAVAAAALCGACLVAAPGIEGVRWADVLKQSDAWYTGTEARRIAASVRAWQEPSGGWPKNVDMTLTPPARSGARPDEATIDNQATVTQIRYLARVYAATQAPADRDAALRGIDYLLAAQYSNGGWPQYFPLRADYSRHITFNDGAMIGVMTLLDEIAGTDPGWSFAGEHRRGRAADAVRRGVDVILRAQVRVAGTPTSWCAQHDEVTLEPRKARAYEHVSLSGSESVGIVRFLMHRKPESPQIDEAVDAAVAWFERVKLTGWRLERVPAPALPGGVDRVMVRDRQAGPLWARFYDIATNRPIYSGRDGIIRQSLAEIEHERRIGYEWVGEWPRALLEREYPRWRAGRQSPRVRMPASAIERPRTST